MALQPNKQTMPAPADSLPARDRANVYLHVDLKRYAQSFKPPREKTWAFWDVVVRKGLEAIAAERCPPKDAA